MQADLKWLHYSLFMSIFLLLLHFQTNAMLNKLMYQIITLIYETTHSMIIDDIMPTIFKIQIIVETYPSF